MCRNSETQHCGKLLYSFFWSRSHSNADECFVFSLGAALTVLALCAYAADKNIGTEMLNWLRGPRPLNGQEISFLNDRFRDGKTYLPFTYFAGATPENNYTPSCPYTITVESNHVSGEEAGYMKLFIPCGGADDPRPVKLRQRGSDGKWFLWEQYLLTGVRMPKASDPWA